jgi:drug/metabolite transporter (DMT)-like permease
MDLTGKKNPHIITLPKRGETVMSPTGRFRAILQALLVTFLWSTSWVLIKLSLKDIPPLTFAGLRYFLAVIILLPGLRNYRSNLRQLTKKDWWQLALLGLVFYTFTQGGQFMTLNHLEAISFSLLLNFSSVLVAIFGIFSLKEIPSPLQWGGIAVFLLGVLVYFSPLSALGGNTIGFLLAGITVCANAAASILGRAVNRKQSIPPRVVTVISMGIGAVVLLGTGLAVEDIPSLSWANVGVILWLAIVNTAFAFLLWNKSLRILSAVESSVINNTMLVQIAVLAWAFLGEKLSPVDIIGLALASMGIILTNLKLGKAKKNNAATPVETGEEQQG